MLVVERWILAALRKRRFFSLAALNEAIAELLERLNHRSFRKLEGSRATRFEKLDRPALRPLPSEPYIFAQWKKARVHIDYHVEVEGHFYSAPYALVHHEVDVRYTTMTVEIFKRSWREIFPAIPGNQNRCRVAALLLMSFKRHSEIYPNDRVADQTASAPAHRLDEFPAG